MTKKPRREINEVFFVVCQFEGLVGCAIFFDEIFIP